MEKMIAGVDIGGTSIKIGLFDWDGKMHDKWKIPTNTENQGAAIAADIWQSIDNRVKTSHQHAEIAGIGIGAPGFVDVKKGIVYEAANIGWKNSELKKEFSQYTGVPVFLENDANIAVLGEHWLGAGKEADNLVVVTLGTGIGGGILVDGQILHGENGISGEIGHIIVNPAGYMCNCGRRGCLETIASATGIVRLAMEHIHRNPAGKLAEIYNKEKSITAEKVFAMEKVGDKDASDIVNHIGEILGLAFANLAVIFNPSKILIGGGVSGAGKPLLSIINQAFVKYALPKVSSVCTLDLATLGNDAGIIGAAYLVKQNTVIN